MRKRTKNNARFATVYTDEILLSSLAKALENASVQPVEVASLAGCSVRYAKDRLNELAKEGTIDSQLIGNVRVFRLKT